MRCPVAGAFEFVQEGDHLFQTRVIKGENISNKISNEFSIHPLFTVNVAKARSGTHLSISTNFFCEKEKLIT